MKYEQLRYMCHCPISGGDDWRILDAKSGLRIADVDPTKCGMDPQEVADLARRIVRAYNSHDALLEAARAILSHVSLGNGLCAADSLCADLARAVGRAQTERPSGAAR
ncbi:MAG: hypothetical protein IH945_02100 [Armatimonadetes bacterium]|nr:hypothetical protein [Armatimonadota bacterium]